MQLNPQTTTKEKSMPYENNETEAERNERLHKTTSPHEAARILKEDAEDFARRFDELTQWRQRREETLKNR